MTRSFLLTLVLFVGAAFSVSAQNHTFTGSIKYQITYPGNTNSAMISKLPQTVEMIISGNKSKFDLTLPNGKYTFITNGDETTFTRLIDATEGKFFIKKRKEEIMVGEPPITVPTPEVKTIAGYKCKSVEITTTERGGKTQKSNAFYSADLGTNNIYFNTSAKAVKGILLDMDYTAMGITMHLTATEVNPGRVSNKNFEIPSDYTETTEVKLHQLKQANKQK
jgi:hypothetical protein